MRYPYNKELINDAVKIYGQDVVESVIDMVSVSDPDGAYTLFKDQDMCHYAECVEMLYFEK